MLIDTTLREGAQLFAAYLSQEQRKHIAVCLIEMGIDEIELGWCGQDGVDKLASELLTIKRKTQTSIWCPCRVTDIKKASTIAVDRINIGVPVSDSHLEKRLRLSREALLEKMEDAITAALGSGFNYVSIGLEDISRTDIPFAIEVAKKAKKVGATRIRLADSLGLLSPNKMREVVHQFSQIEDLEVAVHCHDDFGMATANTITALDSGAHYGDVSLLGTGERSGIAKTEEVLAYLLLQGNTDHYSLQGIRPLCQYLSSLADIPISRTKAVVGRDIFAAESGLHVHGLHTLPELFEPYDPGIVGGTRKIALGEKSGRGAVRLALQKYGVNYSADSLGKLASMIRKNSHKHQRPLTKEEVLGLCRNIT